MSIERPRLTSSPATPKKPYLYRLIRQVVKNTLEVSWGQQVITVAALGLISIAVNLLLGLLPPSLAWPSLYAVLGILGIAVLLILVVNTIRAPFILEREQGQEIADLELRLHAAEAQAAALQDAATNKSAGEIQHHPEPKRRDLIQKPNLILRRAWVGTLGEAEYEKSEGKTVVYGALLEFKNDSEADYPVVGATVRAAITFESTDGADLRSIKDGAWLKVRAARVEFRLGDTHSLVLAVKDFAGVHAIEAHEYDVRPIYKAFEYINHPLQADDYNVEVELMSANQPRSYGKYRFRLTTRHELAIEKVA